jgi:COP9 signalosome complex subunit 3
LLAKTYNAGAHLIATDLTDIDPARTAVKATDVLLFCYYGGMLATGKCGIACIRALRHGRNINLP